MNRLYVALLLALCLSTSPVIADPICQAPITASSANIAATWTLSPSLQGLRNVQSIFVVNTTNRVIFINCSYPATTAPSDNSKASVPIGGPGGDTTWAMDNAGGGSACWYKASGGAATSGVFKFCVTGN